MSLRHQERITVEKDGEEIDVWNFLNVTLACQVRGGNPVTEEFPGDHRITMGGGGTEPDYVTSWVAEELWHNYDIDLFDGHREFDIEVVDLEDDEVTVL